MYSDIQTQNATMWKTETIYIYLSRNLIITYSIAVFITALAVILGGFAYLANGVAQDISASTIATTMQDPGVSFSSKQSHIRTSLTKLLGESCARRVPRGCPTSRQTARQAKAAIQRRRGICN